MHASWRNFLEQRGARFTAEGVVHFGDPATELRAADHGTVIADLSQDGLIRVDGTDSRAFLHGQLSTDIQALTPHRSQMSSWSNAKGRVITLLRLWERDGATYMTLPLALSAPVQKRLSMYVLRSKVQISDARDILTQFGIAGCDAPGLLTACGWSVPAETNIVTSTNGGTLTRLHGDMPRFVLQAEPGNSIPVWNALEGKGACPVGNDPWSLLRILAREPRIHPETSEHFVAQMLGLEELGAINFKKGCYIGQEVIARAHYRGAVKRHLCRAYCESTMPIRPGTPVLAGGSDQAVGEVVDVCRDVQGTTQMLAVILDDYQSALLHLADETAVSLTD